MLSYAFWNNKGGVGKTFLSFITSSEYANRHPESDVYVIDMCPQANLSETLLGGVSNSPGAISELIGCKPRKTVAGYVEARLNSPFKDVDDVGQYVTRPYDFNNKIPKNMYLVCGDYLLEVLSEAIRQTSQLSVPFDSWKTVMGWISDLKFSLNRASGERETVFFVDCNPSFAIYTQIALVASDDIVVPFTADDSSRRAIENVIALLYGIGDPHVAAYAKISFSNKAREYGVDLPKLHSFLSNRVTFYKKKPSRAFKAVSKSIKETMDSIHKTNRGVFSDSRVIPSKTFLEIPDYHSACIVAAVTGTPLHRLKAGPKNIGGERIQLNIGPLNDYRSALGKIVDKM